jgi:hypothetical protein
MARANHTHAVTEKGKPYSHKISVVHKTDFGTAAHNAELAMYKADESAWTKARKKIAGSVGSVKKYLKKITIVGIPSIVALIFILAAIPGGAFTAEDNYCGKYCESYFNYTNWKYDIKVCDVGGLVNVSFSKPVSNYTALLKVKDKWVDLIDGCITKARGEVWEFKLIVEKDAWSTVKWSAFMGDASIDPLLISEVIGPNSKDTDLLDGKRQAIIGGQRYVKEDKLWVTVETAKSLYNVEGGYNIVYLEKDDRWKVTINDFNWTWINFTIDSKDEDVLVRFNGQDSSSDASDRLKPGTHEIYFGNADIKIGTDNVSFITEASSLFEFSNISFGKASTTVQINDENMIFDICIRRDANLDFGFQTKFIVASILPENAILQNAVMHIEWYGNTSSGSSFYNMSKWLINDQTWDESSAASTINSQSKSVNTYENINFGVDADANVTAQIISTLSSENDNFTVRFEDNRYPIYTVDAVFDVYNTISIILGRSGYGVYNFTEYLEEDAPSANTYLNITYEDNFIRYSQNSTNSTLAGNWVSHNLFWNSSNLSGYIFSFNNGTNWTDMNCNSYNNSQSSCSMYGCTWNPTVYNTKTYSFINSSTAQAYGVSRYTGAGGTVVTANLQNDFAAIPPSWIQGWNATANYAYNFTDYNAGYRALMEPDGVKLAVINSSLTDKEPFARFNFTITEDKNSIYFVNINLRYSEATAGSTGTNEYCYAAVANFTNGNWFLTSSVTSSTLTNKSINFTNSDVAKIIEPTTGRLGILIFGRNMDNVEGCIIDWVEVTIGYNSTTQNCAGTSNYEFKNDSWVPMTGTQNWSNVTKYVSESVGATIKWYVWANNTNGLSNQTEIFQYVTTSGGGPGACDCPGIDADWDIDMTENCEINAACNIGTGNISFTGAGYFYCNATITSSNRIPAPGAGQHVRIRPNCHIRKS